jgi:hypothetical protein
VPKDAEVLIASGARQVERCRALFGVIARTAYLTSQGSTARSARYFRVCQR